MPSDYQTLLQMSALRFLQIHQCQHLSDDQKLIDRTVDYLVNDHDVLTQTANRIVNLAMSELNSSRLAGS